MPTFRAIDNAEVSVDTTLSQATVQSLKDNIEAIFQGDDTAPAISLNAFATTQALTEGNALVLQLTTTVEEDKDPAFKAVCRLPGTFSVRLECRLGDTPDTDSDDGALQSNTVQGIVKKNSSGTITTVGTLNLSVVGENNSSNHYTEITDTVALAAGDFIFVDLNTSGNHPAATMILSIGVTDKNCMYGVHLYGEIV